MSGYSTVQEHREMFFDPKRNAYYFEAISDIVEDGDVVMDLGAGLGLHGFMAASVGAQKVYMVEPASIIDVAAQLAEANGYSSKIQCVSGKIEEVSLPSQVDVIVSVFTGNFLLAEDLLPSLFYARDKYLRPGGRLIPDAAVMEVVPVNSPDLYQRLIDCWDSQCYGLELDLVRDYAVNTLYYGVPDNIDSGFLSEPVELHQLDFMTASKASCHNQVDVTVNQSGTCHGWVGWFKTRVGEKWLSTSPVEDKMHWNQVFLPVSEPIHVDEGEVLSFQLIRPDFGEWTWSVTAKGKREQHSTFNSGPLTLSRLKKKSDSYQPLLSKKGFALRDLLHRLDGEQTTASIIDYIEESYPELFPSQGEAARFVKRWVEVFS